MGGKGVAFGSHWGIALAMAPGQPFPVCFCKRVDAAAGSAWVPSFGLAFTSWCELMQELSWLRARVTPLPSCAGASAGPSPLRGEAIHFPSREEQVGSCPWDVPSGLVSSSSGRSSAGHHIPCAARAPGVERERGPVLRRAG